MQTRKRKIMFDEKQIEENKKKYKIIYNAWDARNLLKMGHTIVDIKPKKWDKKETVFVFAVDDTLFADVDKIKAEAKTEQPKE